MTLMSQEAKQAVIIIERNTSCKPKTVSAVSQERLLTFILSCSEDRVTVNEVAKCLSESFLSVLN